ncbi:MAG: redoxin domain-containing protein, partial [Planctomycetota bacterium]
LYYAADCLAKSGKAEDAVSYVDDLAMKYPGEAKYVQAVSSKVGHGLMSEGKFEKAASMYRRSTDAGSRYGGLYLVETLWALGKYDEARAEAKKLLANFEDGTEAKLYKNLLARAEAAGNPAPKFEVEGWAETSFDPAMLEGTVYLVYFWDMKKLGLAKGIERRMKTVYERYRDEGFQVVALSKHTKYDLVEGKPAPGMSADEELKQLQTWVFNYKAPWMFGLCADKRNHDAFGFWAPPHFAIVGKGGRLRFSHFGKEDVDYQVVSKVVEKLLDEAK